MNIASWARAIIVTFILIALIGRAGLVRGASTSPLQTRDLVGLVQIPYSQNTLSVTISPDGTHVAYVSVTQLSVDSGGANRETERKQLWIDNVNGGHPVRIGQLKANCWAPVWSPDGEELAFYTASSVGNHLAVWNTLTNNVRNFSIALDSSAQPAQWTPDGGRILIASSVSGTSPSPIVAPAITPAPVITVLTSNPNTSNKTSGNLVSRKPFSVEPNVGFALVDVRTGAVTTVATNVRPAYYQLSPDGEKLLYTTDRGMVNSDINERVIFDVTVIDLYRRSKTIVAQDILMGYASSTVTWSLDGSMIAFVGGNLQDAAEVPPGNYGDGFPGSCYVVDLRHPRVLRRIGERQLNRLQGHMLWSKDNLTIYAETEGAKGIVAISRMSGKSRILLHFSDAILQSFPQLFYPTGNHVRVLVQTNNGQSQIRDLDLHFGRTKVLFRSKQALWYLTFDRDGARAAYSGQDVSHPEDVWITDQNLGHPRQLTHLNPQIRSQALSNEEENVIWKTRSGASNRGIVLLPAGYQRGRRYPAILWVYAGEPTGTEYRNLFGINSSAAPSYENLELFATRGYAVFVPDSTLRVGNPMRDIASAILPGVDKIVAMGIADPTRIGVYGQSYGGYSVFSLIVQTNRFKAAVATSGTVDLVSFYAALYPNGSDWTGWAENEQGRMGGTLWQYRNRYIDNSPLFYLDRVQTPVLLEYGAEDTANAFNMREAFVALRRLGKTATLVGYADDGHTLLKVSNQMDFTNRMLNWFAHYLSR